VVMVLSASSITSIRETGTPYGYFLDQAKFALVGVPAMVVASRIPVRWYRRLAWPALGLGLVLQSLILSPLARGEKGNTNWIYIPGLGQTIQPSRSEEHTSELQSRENLVCRLLLEKKKKAGDPER